MLSILFLVSTIFDLYALPSIPIGIGHLIVTDVLPFLLIGIVILRSMVESSAYLVHTPLDLPLLAFYCVAILSTVIAIADSTITFNQSLGELRVVNFYLVFFIVTNLIRSKRQLARLVTGLFVLATLVALAMIAQFALGNSVPILAGGVETLSTAGTTSYGITRVLPPGQSIILVALISLSVLVILNRSLPRFVGSLFQFFVIGLAVLLTFNRSFWVMIFLALLVVGVMVSMQEKVKYAQIAIVIIVIGVVALAALPVFGGGHGGQIGNLVDSTVVRASTLFNPNTANEDSLQYRYIENGYAFPQIETHPLVGLGLGADYRPYDSRIDFTRTPNYDKYAYIHNGHLWVMLKTGLLGYFFLMWALFLFLKRGFQNWKRIPDPFMRGIALSFTVTILGVLIVTIVNPLFSVIYWTPVIAVLLGVNEVIFRLFIKESSQLHTAV